MRREDVEAAIGDGNKSSPGPDRIPYMAWKRLGKLGVDLLYAAANELSTPDARTKLVQAAFDPTDTPSSASSSSSIISTAATTGAHDFNMGRLCCLPKKNFRS